MTPEQINRAIAEWMGWDINDFPWRDGSTRGYPPGTTIKIGGKDMAFIPNFYASLDAVHEAIKKLLFSQRARYRSNLRLILSRPLNQGASVSQWGIDIEECIDADSPARCEALLRALNLWKN